MIKSNGHIGDNRSSDEQKKQLYAANKLELSFVQLVKVVEKISIRGMPPFSFQHC